MRNLYCVELQSRRQTEIQRPHNQTAYSFVEHICVIVEEETCVGGIYCSSSSHYYYYCIAYQCDPQYKYGLYINIEFKKVIVLEENIGTILTLYINNFVFTLIPLVLLGYILPPLPS